MRFISKIVLSTSNGVFFPKDIFDLPPLFTNSARNASDPNNFVPQLNAEIFPDLFINYLCKKTKEIGGMAKVVIKRFRPFASILCFFVCLFFFLEHLGSD